MFPASQDHRLNRSLRNVQAAGTSLHPWKPNGLALFFIGNLSSFPNLQWLQCLIEEAEDGYFLALIRIQQFHIGAFSAPEHDGYFALRYQIRCAIGLHLPQRNNLPGGHNQ